MTIEQALRLLKKVPAGEYRGDMRDIYITVARKGEVDEYGLLTRAGEKRYCEFLHEIYPKRYGISNLTGGRVRYTGTNDLDTFSIG